MNNEELETAAYRIASMLISYSHLKNYPITKKGILLTRIGLHPETRYWPKLRAMTIDSLIRRGYFLEPVKGRCGGYRASKDPSFEGRGFVHQEAVKAGISNGEEYSFKVYKDHELLETIARNIDDELDGNAFKLFERFQKEINQITSKIKGLLTE